MQWLVLHRRSFSPFMRAGGVDHSLFLVEPATGSNGVLNIKFLE